MSMQQKHANMPRVQDLQDDDQVQVFHAGRTHAKQRRCMIHASSKDSVT